MSLLIATSGISGSGKTRFRNQLTSEFPQIRVVCPDDIRRELTGSVSDQSQNSRVFSVAYTRTRQLLATGKIALFDATNSGPKPVKSLIIETRPTETLLILMRDAEDLDLCVKRVERDVDKGVDRSAVPREIIEKQYVRFINFVTNVESLKDFGVSVLWSDDIDRIREVINDN